MKKRLLLFLMSLVATFYVAFSAQRSYDETNSTAISRADEAYKPFVEPGKTWRYKLVDDYGWISEDGKPCDDDLMDITIGQPMQIDAEEWHPLYVRQYSVNPQNEIEPFGYIKEDLANKIVYWKANDSNPYDFNVALNYPIYNILYDYSDAYNPESVWYDYGYDRSSVEFEGVKYNVFTYSESPIVLAERLGIVEKTDEKSYGGSTILGCPVLPTGTPGYLYIAYIYEVNDGQGNILYQRPENRPSASISDGLTDAMAVTVAGDKVSFTGAPGCALQITNMQGMVVWRGQTDSAGRAISTSLSKGAYVAKHGSRTTKVIVNQ